MAMLHTVNKSPFERNAMESCLAHAPKGGGILFIEDGVYAAMQGTSCMDKIAKATTDFTIYVLGPDVKARGMDVAKVVDGVKVVDYAGFVDLVTQYETVQSWL